MPKFKGLSGELFDFFELPWMGREGIPQQPGILIFAGGVVGWPEPVMISDTPSLRSAFLEHERRAREEFEATLLFVRAETSATPRKAIQADLSVAYGPPMNLYPDSDYARRHR